MTERTVEVCPESDCVVWSPHVHGGEIVIPKREAGK